MAAPGIFVSNSALAMAVLTASLLNAEGTRHVVVQEQNRQTIYHSPQTPGYTSWAGVWLMPDNSLIATFTQITGPVAGWRQRAPAEILKRMPTAQQDIPAYDMTGLIQENVLLRSTDQGKTWQPYSSDPFSSALNGYVQGSAAVLADGTVLRMGWGQSLTYCDVRPTGFVQRSADAAKTWGPPEYLSSDERLQTFPTRIRLLRDGRLMITGGAAAFDPGTWHWMDLLPKTRHCLWISRDAAGRSWSEPLFVTPNSDFSCEEWDTAELDNGDLLAVFRAITYDGTGKYVKQDRRQSILTKSGETWQPGQVTMTPFAHDGHPELLRTREGIILHIAPTALSWTDDGGRNWTRLDCAGTGYYPHAVQLADGAILAVGHVGNDDAYGKTDQSIVLNRIRLTVSD